nr:sce7726 family protein [Rummeliibacillus stabekisii]
MRLHKDNQNKSYRVIEELTICNGAVRVDVALANGVFHGFEIKSDLDTLERLPKQVECYDTTFDKNTIIVGERFVDKIEQHVPKHWGIEIAYLNKFGNVTLKKIRRCGSNKSVEFKSLLDLLWNNELKNLLKDHKIKGYSKMKREDLHLAVIENIPFKSVKDYTRETLKTRIGWRADLPLT